MHKLIYRLLILSGAAFMTSYAGAQSTALYANSQYAVHDSLQVTKLNQQSNQQFIIIDPNPSNGNMRVKNIYADAKEVHFYVFDLDGVMIENIRLHAREVKKINGLSKGVYLYDVFEKDESIERGKIIVH